MSSSSEEETFTIGAQVDATDGRCGRLASVIFDPVADAVTHLIVETEKRDALPRLVPVEHFVGVEDDVIKLNFSSRQFEQLDEAEDAHFLSESEMSPGHGPHSYAWPYYEFGGLGLPLGHHREAMFDDRVPVHEVEIRRGDPVHASDGEIGAVQGLVIDRADHHVTHLLLQEGHFWGRKQVAIPIGAAKRSSGEVRVDLTKEEIEALPPVTIKPHG